MDWFAFDSHFLVSSLLLLLAIQMVFFLLASILRTDVFTDMTYAASFIVLALTLFLEGGDYQPVKWLLVAMIVVWAVRLGGYLLLRILHMGRDRRFDGIRDKPLRFLIFWVLQGVSIWLLMLPVTLALSRSGDWSNGVASLAGLAIWSWGFVWETVADWQKWRFRTNPDNDGKFLASGLWRLSRHPNYFGEMLCWWGVFVIAAPALEGWLWLAVIGPVYLTLLLRFGTGVPTVARQQLARYGHLPSYREYLDTTNLLVPGGKRRAGGAGENGHEGT